MITPENVRHLLAACALDITGPQTDLTGLPAGLDVQFTVEPGEVRQHAPFTARLTVTNTTSDTLRVTTRLVRGPGRVPHPGRAQARRGGRAAGAVDRAGRRVAR
jgi:hypothetical protein